MQNQFIDVYRNGIRTATDVARMSLEAGMRMQEKQLEIVRGIVQEQSRTAEEITRAGSMEELLALQSRLVSAQMGRAVEFWSSVWQTAAQTHAEGLRGMQSFTSRSAEDVAHAAAAQVSRAAGSVAESADAANQNHKGQRRSA
jgi:phasin family protein